MLELGLLDSKMSQFPQSLQAIAAIYTAKKYMQFSADGSAASSKQGSSSSGTLNLSELG